MQDQVIEPVTVEKLPEDNIPKAVLDDLENEAEKIAAEQEQNQKELQDRLVRFGKKVYIKMGYYNGSIIYKDITLKVNLMMNPPNHHQGKAECARRVRQMQNIKNKN